MATQNPQDQAAMIDAIAAQTMGVEPAVPQQAAPASEPKKDTAADTAAEKGSPGNRRRQDDRRGYRL